MAKLNIKKDDTVVVITGKDKGKKGKVMSVLPSKGTALVEGVNLATKHKKPRKQNEQGGIIKQEAPIQLSNVMLVCSKCGKATRPAKKILEDGRKVRVCKKCGDTLDK